MRDLLVVIGQTILHFFRWLGVEGRAFLQNIMHGWGVVWIFVLAGVAVGMAIWGLRPRR